MMPGGAAAHSVWPVVFQLARRLRTTLIKWGLTTAFFAGVRILLVAAMAIKMLVSAQRPRQSCGSKAQTHQLGLSSDSKLAPKGKTGNGR